MKKNFFKLQQLFLATLVAGAMVSCEKDNDPTPEPEFTPEELAEMAAAEKYAAANSVYRALALIDELPDNWESTTFTPAEGVAVSEAENDVRNVVSTGADQAKSYFLSIVPDEGLNGDTWSHEGVGTLTFQAVNKDNCYAVIDVDLVQMPGLKQLRFVPEAVVGENSFSGEPYYRVGDVIKDTKKDIYWICVRPSGGPLKKDNAYFVSFDKSLIKTYEYKQDIYNVTGVRDETKKSKERMEHLSGKWVYAKNLVEERIAMSAAFVFAMFSESNRLSDTRPHYANFKAKAELLKGVFDPSKLTYSAENEDKIFFVAYGSYQSSVKRMTQVKYAQPLLRFTLYPTSYEENGYVQFVTKAWNEEDDPYIASNSLLSLTDSHDPFTYSYLGYYNDRQGYDLKGHGKFSVLDYTIGFAPEAQFSDLPKQESEMYLTNKFNKNIPLIMTQMSLKDHGKPVSGYEVVHVKLDPDKEPNYWGAIESCVRETFEKGLEEKQLPVKE